MYEWSELIKLWELEQLTTEQVIGQLLRHGQHVHRAHTDTLRQVDILVARVTALEALQTKRAAS